MDIAAIQDQQTVDCALIRATEFTPRSAECFQRTGVLPMEIVCPTIQEFAGAADPEIAQIRLKNALEARNQKMKLLVADYNKILQMDAEGRFEPEASKMTGCSQSIQQSGKGRSTLIDLERRALNRMKFKQQKEIEKMLEAEFHRKAVEKKNEEKERAALLKDQQRREA